MSKGYSEKCNNYIDSDFDDNDYDDDEDIDKQFEGKIDDVKQQQPQMIGEMKIHFGKTIKNSQSQSSIMKNNRQLARQCRQRKKIYIELLEKKVAELRQQINGSKAVLRKELTNLDELISDIDSDKMQYLSQKMEIQKGINDSNSDQEFRNSIDLYLHKFDVNGKLRKQLVSTQFENLLKFILDHKLLNYWDSSLGVTDLFDTNCYEIFSIEASQTIQYPLATNIQNNRSTMLHLLMQIRDVKRNLEAQGKRIQFLVQKLTKYFDNKGIANLILDPLYTKEEKTVQL